MSHTTGAILDSKPYTLTRVVVEGESVKLQTFTLDKEVVLTRAQYTAMQAYVQAQTADEQCGDRVITALSIAEESAIAEQWREAVSGFQGEYREGC